MADKSMPEYANEPNEWESNTSAKLPRHIEVQMNMFTQRLQVTHSLDALLPIRQDIERGSLVGNAGAIEQLRRSANQRAHEMGFKGEWWGS